MSAALLRKGLDLLGPASSDQNITKKPSKNNQKDDLISHKTGMKRRLKRLKRQGTPQTQRATAKDRVIKSAVEEYKKSSAKDYLAQNLQYMLGSKSATKQNVVSKILQQNRGRKSRDLQMKKKRTVEQKSVFSDQDFKRFEREYFGSR